jgi:hypothetical protein
MQQHRPPVRRRRMHLKAHGVSTGDRKPAGPWIVVRTEARPGIQDRRTDTAGTLFGSIPPVRQSCTTGDRKIHLLPVRPPLHQAHSAEPKSSGQGDAPDPSLQRSILPGFPGKNFQRLSTQASLAKCITVSGRFQHRWSGISIMRKLHGSLPSCKEIRGHNTYFTSIDIE